MQLSNQTETLKHFDSDSAEFFEKFGSLDPAVWCTRRSLTPWRDAHRVFQLHGVHQAASKISGFVFLNLWCLLTTFYQKTSELQKISWTICDFQSNFLSIILRHHREITITKFRIKTDTWQVTDSAVWCTLQSLTLRYDAHSRFFYILFFCVHHTVELDSVEGCTPQSQIPRDDAYQGAWLCGMIHTAEIFKILNISAKSKLNSKIL